MHRDLAEAVFHRWEQGLPVSESFLYKAASVLGVDPDAALTEARFLTAFDKYASADRPMTAFEQAYFALAAGEIPGTIEKVAGTYGVNYDELLVRKLANRGFHPDLEKIALMPPPEAIQEMMAAQMQQQGEGGGGGEGGAQEDPQAAAQQAMAPQGPMQGAQLQQDPAQRFKPAPTAPDQIPPNAMGNLDALIQEQQGVHGQQAEENGGLPASGMPDPAAPAPSPEERVQQVAPGMDPETTQRYSQKLTEFEQQMGMAISDPKQMVKFVQALQKVDTKYLDEGIKQFAQQQEQEAGIGQTVQTQPTVPGFGADSGGGGAAGPGGEAAGGATPPGGATGAGGPPGKPKVQPGQPLPAAQAAGTKPKQQQGQDPREAAEKVAHIGRLLAHRANLEL